MVIMQPYVMKYSSHSHQAQDDIPNDRFHHHMSDNGKVWQIGSFLQFSTKHADISTNSYWRIHEPKFKFFTNLSVNNSAASSALNENIDGKSNPPDTTLTH